ncbi:ape1 [Gossypium arboreum]|nr:ape1 [Gossypium arboreum]
MSGNGHCFEWMEEFISQERGNLSVQLSVLRGVLGICYVVAEEFVRVYGAENSIHAGFKWSDKLGRVVDLWNSCFLGNFTFPDCEMIEISAWKAQALDNMGYLLRNLTEQSSDIV